MNQPSAATVPDASALLVDVPIRFFTAIRTHRFYPAAAPQVQLSRNILLSSIAEVRRSVGDSDVTMAVADSSISVCGSRLSKKDLSRQQIRGLRNFFNQFAIQSLVFHDGFDELDCALFLHQLVDLMERRENGGSASTLLQENPLSSVSVVGRIQEGEQTGDEAEQGAAVPEKTEETGRTAAASANTRSSLASQQVLSRELVEECTGLPLGSESFAGEHEELLNAVLDVLFNLDLETEAIKRNRNIEESARTLSGIAPGLLARLLAQLPLTPVGDACFFSVLQELSPTRLEQVMVQLEVMALQQGEGGQQAKATLNRLAGMDESTRTDLRETLALHSDARELLAGMLAGERPSSALQQRLGHPKWSAAVLAAAAQQSVTAADHATFAAFNQALQLVDRETEAGEQGLVIRLAAARIAQLGPDELGGLVLRPFRGLFGERLYEAVLAQVSDPLLDQTIEHLSPRQLNRIVAELINDYLPQADVPQPEDLIPMGSALFRKLARTRQAPRVQEEIGGQLDTRILQATGQSDDLPEALRTRLQEPKWAARVLAISAVQATDPQNFRHGRADFAPHERLLRRYALFFDKDRLSEIAADAATRLAALSEEELGLLLMRPEGTAFGEEIKEVLFRKLSGSKAGRIATLLRKKRDNLSPLALALERKELQAAYKRVLHRLRGAKAEGDAGQEQGEVGEDAGFARKMAEEPMPETHLLQELVHSGPETLRLHLRRGEDEQARALLGQLVTGLRHGNPDLRIGTASALAVCTGILAQDGQWQHLDPLLPALGQVLRTPGLSQGDAALLISSLSRLCLQRLQEQRPLQAAAALRILQAFSETQADEDNSQRLNVALLAREALQQCAMPETLEALFDQYLHADTMRDAAAQALAAMGIESARYQIRQLLLSENSVERARILHLLAQGGKTSVIALLEQLNMESPWFVSRSIIRLIGELGTSLLFTALQPFLAHEDIRVQQETLGAGSRIGGEHAKEFLIRALQQVDDALKREVIGQILQNRDDCFVHPLTRLARESGALSAKNGEELRHDIVQALETIGSKRALNALAEMGVQPQESTGAQQAVQDLPQEGPTEPDGQSLPAPEPIQPPESGQQVTAPRKLAKARSPEEEQFFRLIDQGDVEKAKGFLLGLVSSAARQGDFARAEDLQHHLYSIEGLALREIIQAEELIERAKQELIPQEDLHIWEALHNRLSTEEFQAVYHSFEHRIYAAEEPLVRQGERNDNLFFINQGSVKVSYSDGKKDIFVTTLNRGRVAGESFFTPSIWTVTLSALIRVQAYLLPRSATVSWEERFPGLRNKLLQFYDTFDHTWSVLERKKLERRRHERFNLSRKILVQPLNQHDYPMGRGFRAETLDISIGGLAFLVRIGRQENARILLGRKMQTVFPVKGEAPYQYLPGTIIGVQPYQLLESDYSVHFRFDRPLHQEQLQTILR